MFERYTEPARRSLFFARYEASVLGSMKIETEHLLLGVLKQLEPVVAHMLGKENVEAGQIKQLIYARTGASTSHVEMSVEIPFSADAKRVLECTAEEAERLLHQYIGSEHVLLGLLRVERGLAWDVLREQGLRLAPVREALVMHASASAPQPTEISQMLAAMVPGGAPHAQRSGPIYFMTALDGPTPGRRPAAGVAGGGGFSTSRVGFATRADRPLDGRMHSIGPISMSATTLPQFAVALEEFLDAPVMVNDLLLSGTFDLELEGKYDTPEALIAAVRDQLGLELTRSVT